MVYRSHMWGTALHRDGDSHTLSKYCTRLIDRHVSVSSVMLAALVDFIRGRHVRSEAERRFVLPRLSCRIVLASKFIGKTVSMRVEGKTNNSVKRFCREELDFGIDATVLKNFRRHGTTHHITQGQVLDNSPSRGKLKRKYLLDGVTRTQDLGVVFPVEWPIPHHHQCRRAHICTRDSKHTMIEPRAAFNKSGRQMAFFSANAKA